MFSPTVSEGMNTSTPNINTVHNNEMGEESWSSNCTENSTTLLKYHQHRAVVALNNAGVTLVQRNLFDEAIATYRDAVMIANANESTAPISLQDIITKALHESSKRTSLTAGARTHIRQQKQQQMLLSDCRTFTVSTQDDIVRVVDLIEESEYLQSVNSDKSIILCSIIIEDFDMATTDCCKAESQREDFHVAILLYNYAIANYAYSTFAITPSSESNINDESSINKNKMIKNNAVASSLRLLQLSEKIILACHSNESSMVTDDNDLADEVENNINSKSTLEDDDVVVLQFLLTCNLLRMMIYSSPSSSLLTAHSENDWDDNNQSIQMNSTIKRLYYDKLMCLLDYVEDQRMVFSYCYNMTRPPPPPPQSLSSSSSTTTMSTLNLSPLHPRYPIAASA